MIVFKQYDDGSPVYLDNEQYSDSFPERWVYHWRLIIGGGSEQTSGIEEWLRTNCKGLYMTTQQWGFGIFLIEFFNKEDALFFELTWNNS